MKERKKPRLKRNDVVVVVTGRDRGRQGKILKVLPTDDRVIVERVNMIKRHVRPNPSKNIAGGISEKEAPIHISNVMLVDPKENKPTRVGTEIDAEGRRHRITKRSGTQIDD